MEEDTKYFTTLIPAKMATIKMIIAPDERLLPDESLASSASTRHGLRPSWTVPSIEGGATFGNSLIEQQSI
jgi:hypothetical protein